jgi:CRP/FNR family transcriptional regulator
MSAFAATAVMDRSMMSTWSPRSGNAKSPYGLPLTSRCVSEALRHNECDFSLSEQCLEELDCVSHAATYPTGALMFVEGQNSRGVYVLTQGRIKLTTTNRAGRTLIMKIVQPGEILGLHETMRNAHYELTAETLQPSQVAFIKSDDFLRMLKRHPDACLQVTQQLSLQCESAYEMIRSIGLSYSVTEKLARLILQWSKSSPTRDRVRLSLTHEEIAQLIGSTRETVTRILSDFKKNKVLEVAGSALLIRNKAALERLVS